MPDKSLEMDRFLTSVEKRAFIMANAATGCKEESLDIVQESMMQLVQKYSNKKAEEWRPLFYRILQSRIRDWFRRAKVRNRWRVWLRATSVEENRDPIAEYEEPRNVDPEDVVKRKNAMEKLQSALRSLSLRQQQVFLLRTWEGMSIAETASVMKCSEGSVKTHYSRATLVLRTLLKDEWP